MGFTRIVVKYVNGANENEVVKIRYNGREYRNGDKVPVTAEVELTVTKGKEESYTVDEARRQVKNHEIQNADSGSVNLSDPILDNSGELTSPPIAEPQQDPTQEPSEQEIN